MSNVNQLPVISIDPIELLEVTSSNPNEDYENIKKIAGKTYYECFHVQKDNEDWLDYISIYADNENDIIGSFHLSYSVLMSKLYVYLNVDINNSKLTSKNIENKFYERLRILRRIRNKYELKKEFPLIYQEYEEPNQMRIEFDSLAEEDDKDAFRRFQQKQIKMYQSLLENREEFRKKASETSLNTYLLGNIDKDKAAMYIANEYLNMAASEEAKETIKGYLRQFEKYLSSSYNKDVNIIIDNKLINFESLKKKYDLVKSKVETKNYTIKGDILVDGKEVREITGTTSKPRELRIEDEELKRLQEIGRKKQAFYASTAPKAIIRSENRLGYVGYIYPNGYIIFDYDYNKDYPASAIDHAAYAYPIRTIDFQTIDTLNGLAIRRTSKKGRIIHSGNWQERVLDVINTETTHEDQVALDELITKLEENEERQNRMR